MINPPFNYTGSKYRLLDTILPEFDYSKKFFCDIFAGGGSIYTNVIDKYEKILVNDIIKDLIGIHKGLINDQNFVNNVKLLCPKKDDKESFLKLRTSYNEEKTPEKLYALMLSSTNNMIRFNQKLQYNQTFGERSFSDSTQKKIDLFKNHIEPFKNKIIYITESFNKIKINKNSMVYIDPPYSNTSAGYNTIWSEKNDIVLYDYCIDLDKNGSSFMISGALNHDGNRSLLLDKLITYGFKYKELDYDYNKVSRKGNKETTEVIIMNY